MTAMRKEELAQRPAQILVDGDLRSYVADVEESKNDGWTLVARFKGKIEENLVGKKLESTELPYIVISQADETSMSVNREMKHSTLLTVAALGAAN